MIVNVLALALMAFIVWWFWLSKPKAHKSSGENASKDVVEIVADNGTYTPALIETQKNRRLVLRFIRKDPSPCAEKVQFPALDIYADLEVDQPKEITLTPSNPGDYEFTCQMGMYRGKLVVTDS
jgi:plastocyanin domain-containing protein